RLGKLKKDRCNSSDTEIGILTPITDNVPAVSEEGTYRHTWRVTQPLPILCNRRSENPLTYPAASHGVSPGSRKRGRYSDFVVSSMAMDFFL
ncbi:hypothetical protein AVEN_213409-1, partial [Araneus ventricosus]